METLSLASGGTADVLAAYYIGRRCSSLLGEEMMMVEWGGACRSCVGGFGRVSGWRSRVEHVPLVLHEVARANALACIIYWVYEHKG